MWDARVWRRVLALLALLALLGPQASGDLLLYGALDFWNPAIHSALYSLCGRVSPLTCNYLFQLLAGPGEVNTVSIQYTYRFLL